MKRFFSLIVIVVLVAFIAVGCASGVSQEEYDALKQQLEIEKAKTPVPVVEPQGDKAISNAENMDSNLGEIATVMELTYRAPAWRTVETESGYYYYPFENNEDGVLNVNYQDFSGYGDSVNSTVWDSYIEGLKSETIISREESTTVSGVPQLRLSFTKDVNGTIYTIDSITLVTNDYLYTMMFGMPSEIPDDAAKIFDAIVDSISIEAISCAETPRAESAPQTIGQSNALDSAKSYLSFMAFSYKGLIEQLEYEQFSHEDAVYAADHCGADWNEQAALSAKNYLDLMSFSRDGLIEQLEYEGFTHDQAVYGVEANGY